ncbi:MAG TPA: dicarboxylate/amino acid:cation symporter [Gemmatimonadales bacterium]
MRRPSLSLSITAGLLAGLALGLAASASGAGALKDFAIGVEPVGTIWINLVRMCVIPLVVTALVSGVAAIGDVRKLGRVGARTLGFMFGTILLAGVWGLLLALLLVPLAPVSPEAAATLRAAATASASTVAEQAGHVFGIKQFLLDLVPANPMKAAANGALLPLIVFSVALGAAVGALAEPKRRSVVELMDALVAALIKLIGWIMLLAPIGVACLAAPVAARFGWETLRSLGIFVLTVVIGTSLYAAVVLTLLARWLAKVPVLPFAKAITPGVAVAFTTTTSLAALPQMMDTALTKLKISNSVASFVLPLGATLNRPGSAIYQMAAVVTVASLYGIHLGPPQYVAALATSFLMTFSVAAIPSATVFTTAPVMSAAGLPVESIALLLGIDRIPDMFRTGLHAASHQTCAAVVAHGEGEEIQT